MKRTDLALEARELWRENTASALPPGAETETREEGGSTLEALVVTSGEAAEALGKGVGKYITITPEALLRREEGAFEAAAAARLLLPVVVEVVTPSLVVDFVVVPSLLVVVVVVVPFLVVVVVVLPSLPVVVVVLPSVVVEPQQSGQRLKPAANASASVPAVAFFMPEQVA